MLDAAFSAVDCAQLSKIFCKIYAIEELGIAIYQMCVTIIIVLYQQLAAIIQFGLCPNLDKYFTLLKVPEAGTAHTLAGKNTPQ
jgi:hypothetical protein